MSVVDPSAEITEEMARVTFEGIKPAAFVTALIAAVVTSDLIAVMIDASSPLPGGRRNERLAVKGAEMNSVKIIFAPMSSSGCGDSEGEGEGSGGDEDADNKIGD